MTLPVPDSSDREKSNLSMLRITYLRDECLKRAKAGTVPLFQLDDYQLYVNFLDAYIVSQVLMGPAFAGSDHKGEPNHAHDMMRQIILKDLQRISPEACMTAWLTLDEFRWHNHLPILNDLTYPNSPGTDYSYGLVADSTLHKPIKQGLGFILGDPQLVKSLRIKHYNTEGCQVFALNNFRSLRTIPYKEECRLVPPSLS